MGAVRPIRRTVLARDPRKTGSRWTNGLALVSSRRAWVRTVFSVGSWIDRLTPARPFPIQEALPADGPQRRRCKNSSSLLPGPSPQTPRCSITPPSIGEIYAKFPHIVGLGSSRHNMKGLDVILVPLVLSSSVANHESIMYVSCAKKRRQALCDVAFPASSLPQIHDGSDDACEVEMREGEKRRAKEPGGNYQLRNLTTWVHHPSSGSMEPIPFTRSMHADFPIMF